MYADGLGCFSDMRMLRCYVVVATELHFGRAARRLGIAQPAVSRTVRKLETELGVELLRRTKRSVELTEAGHVALVVGHEILQRYCVFIEELTSLGRSSDEAHPSPDVVQSSNAESALDLFHSIE